ncbi:PTS sugar transporter subunit IIA [Vagococcus fluvialis]|uniref:PTS sugar transporter subunit IIA n=1 Tax=Vagococcus fluvialis TaxID=2738 RepID=UPI001D0AA2E9|nr:PTS sugar transporter subunit IIA [Vagococcus fluvialis]UDM78528.1 PTS sugar transporter subunit IIA [Vagococcus fluvialis]
MYFDEEVVLFQSATITQEEALTKLGNKMLEKNIVNEHFLENVLKREQTYPTGLAVNGIGIAIPHTDSEFVIKSQLGFMSLEDPVTFYEMGTLDQEVEVRLIFMLALKEAHEQLAMLQQLIELFQKDEVVEQLLKVSDVTNFLDIMAKQNLN